MKALKIMIIVLIIDLVLLIGMYIGRAATIKEIDSITYYQGSDYNETDIYIISFSGEKHIYTF